MIQEVGSALRCRKSVGPQPTASWMDVETTASVDVAMQVLRRIASHTNAHDRSRRPAYNYDEPQPKPALVPTHALDTRIAPPTARIGNNLVRLSVVGRCRLAFPTAV